MTEERKVQLGIAVDATGAKAGFDQVKQDARDMAQAVGQAGQVAGKGMDAVGEGAKRSADAFTREEGRMRAAIQRVTLDMQTLGKSASEKLEAKINLQGLDAAKFAPYLAALKQAEAQAGATAAAAASMGNAVQQAAAKSAGRATGLVAMAADADHAKASLTDLSRATTSLGAASFANLDKVGTSLGAAAANADAAAAAVQRLDRAIELTGPLATARTSFGAATGPAVPAGSLREAIDRRGQTQIDPRLLASSAASAAPYVAGLRQAEKAQGDLGMSTKQLSFALRQVPMQMTDIVVSLAAGQRPLQVLLQQGGQLKDLFGGIGPAARALGTYALGLVNPFTVGAAAVGVLAFELVRVETAARSLNTLQAQLAGTGRSGMFSDTGLKEFIAELALAPGVTRESATAIVSELSKVHDIGGALFKDLGGLVADYAKATGTDAASAAKTLAQAFKDPEKGAKQLDEALGTLSSTQILTIERLSKMGNTAGAQRALFEALQGAVKGLADNAMTPLQKSTNDLGNSWAEAMRKLDQSEGLRNLNILLGKTVEFVDFLVRNADKLGGLGNIGVGSIPGVGLPAAAASVVGDALGGARVRNAVSDVFGGVQTPGRLEVSGKVTDAASAGAAGAAATKGDDEIKRALEAAKAYRGQAGELADLTNERNRFNAALTKSITEYGKESEQAKRLRQAIVGVDEKIASIKKRGAGGGGNEGQQVLDAQLQQNLKGTRDALEKERDAIAFSQRFLQGVFQAGEISIKDFYANKLEAIQQGTAAQLRALEKDRADVQAHLDATLKTSPKDKSSIVRDKTKLNEIDADVDKLRVEGARQQVLANQEARASFKQLDEQVMQYQASLKSLQGDEIGAARIRDEIARRQLGVLADQSAGTANPITRKDQTDFADAQRQIAALNKAKVDTSLINNGLQIQEERIALAMRSGAIGEIEALNQLGGARAKAVSELEKVVKAQEEVAASRPQDYQLQIDTSQARLELERLKAELDPLKEKFDGLFKDAGATFLEDLMGGKGIKGALRGFADSISKEINGMVAKELSGQIFGKGGLFGDAGGMFADLFGGKDRNKPALDTSGVTTSLTTMQTVGVDPATAALGRFQAALDGAAATVGSTTSRPLPVGSDLPPVADGSGSTGDFARFDRRQSGEQSVMDLFKDADKSGEALADTNTQAAKSVLQFAQAAASGGDAMSMLPSIISMIQAAAATSSASSGGGGLLGSLGSLFGGGGGGGGTFTGTTGLEGMSPDTLALFFADGGYTGNRDPKKPAGVVHGNEYVFSEPAVRAIGVDRLERIHTKAKTGDVDEELPGYSDGGFVAVLGSMRPQAARRGKDVSSGGGNVTNVFHITAGAGVTREQAMNQGRDIQRGMQIQAGRRGRNT